MFLSRGRKGHFFCNNNMKDRVLAWPSLLALNRIISFTDRFNGTFLLLEKYMKEELTYSFTGASFDGTFLL